MKTLILVLKDCKNTLEISVLLREKESIWAYEICIFVTKPIFDFCCKFSNFQMTTPVAKILKFDILSSDSYFIYIREPLLLSA